MNNDLFQQARSAYVSKDYETALAQFTNCLQDTSSRPAPGELGMLYHQIGNCLVKLHDPNEAIHAYSQAKVDTSYDAQGSVSYNLGMVYAQQNDFDDAVTYFQQAVSDPKYQTPYKAYMGLGNSLLKIGKSAEAGAAFRSAALDETNPDPTKALLNLGVCFMALDRPMDAIASYESALQFDMPASLRNKLFANMGQAYVAAGKMNKAVRAFESALADKTYVFNDAANVDFQRAASAVASGASDEPEPEPEPNQAPESEIDQTSSNDLSGLDVSGDGVPVAYQENMNAQPSTSIQLSATNVMREIGPNDLSQTDFFAAQNVEFEDWGQSAAKKKHRHRGLKIVLVIIFILIIVLGVGLFGYTQGYGFPSKNDVVTQMFSDPQNADVFASSVDDSKKMRLQDSIVTSSDVQVKGEANDLNTAHMYVSVTAKEGAEVPYDITLVRDGIGWKVSNVALYFTSQQN